MRARRLLAAAVLALALPSHPTAADAGSPGVASARAGELPGWAPDHVKLQLAGNVGFVSPGVGYSFLRGGLEADAFLGWVPEAIGGSDVFSVTAKVTGQPGALRLRGVDWRPLSLGVQVTYTFGDQYFVRPPGRYPREYYDFPTALRAALAVGTSAVGRVGGSPVGAYLELVALDVMLKAWADNPGALSPADVFSLALGLRVGL